MVAFEESIHTNAADVDDFTPYSSPSERRSKPRVSWRSRDAPSSPTPPSPTPADTTSSFPAPRPRMIFPKQLLEVLSDPCSAGVIEWLVHGHAFAIKKPDRFAKDIMPRFTRGKLTSFQRQLNLYGFRKVTKGLDYKAGALVYFHPAFKRGRPEMMEGIKRIACKGECSLNRLRNEDVPYDPTIPSEETEAPEQDVNSLDIGVRKRSRGWPIEFPALKRTRAAPHTHDGAYEAVRRRMNEDTRSALSLTADPSFFGEVKPRALANGLDAILDPELAICPAAPPAMDLGDLPQTHGSRDAFDASAISEMQRSHGMLAAASLPDEIQHSSTRSTTGVLRTSESTMTPLYSRPFTESTIPRSLDIWAPQQDYEDETPPERLEVDEALFPEDELHLAAEQLTMPPPRSRVTEAAVADLLPLPLPQSWSGAAEKVPSKVHFAKRFGDGEGAVASEALTRSISEVSGFSNASEFWRGCDELAKDLDFAGLFE